MLRVEYTNRSGNVWRGPGALVRLPNPAGEVHCLVAPNPVLPSSALSSLRRVSLYAPAGPVASASSGGIARDWVRRVWGEQERGFTLVELTASAVQAILAGRAKSRAVATAAEGMRTTGVYGSGGALAEKSATIARVRDETLELSYTISEDVLLVGEDGNLLAVTSGDKNNELYSFEKIVNEFMEDRMWQIRY